MDRKADRRYWLLVGLWLCCAVCAVFLSRFFPIIQPLSVSGIIILLADSVQAAFLLLLAIRYRPLLFLPVILLTAVLYTISIELALQWQLSIPALRYLLNSLLWLMLPLLLSFGLVRLLVRLPRGREWIVFHILVGLQLAMQCAVWMVTNLPSFQLQLQMELVSFIQLFAQFYAYLWPQIISAALTCGVYWLNSYRERRLYRAAQPDFRS